MLLERVRRSGDGGVASYVSSMLERHASIHPDSLKDVLRRFGGDCLGVFLQDSGSDSLRRYGSIVVNRNKSAHGGHIQMTFDDVCEYHDDATRLIGAFGHALGVRAPP